MAITGCAIRSVVADTVRQIIARRFAVRGTRAMVIECGERGNWEMSEEIDGLHCGWLRRNDLSLECGIEMLMEV